ncbi:hypothetical protein J6590_006360 [Homalodisca vitripennis]|nr:hypothetical protein J6590_006360 [Homalodisca vitripennis]
MDSSNPPPPCPPPPPTASPHLAETTPFEVFLKRRIGSHHPSNPRPARNIPRVFFTRDERACSSPVSRCRSRLSVKLTTNPQRSDKGPRYSVRHIDGVQTKLKVKLLQLADEFNSGTPNLREAQ